MKISKAEFKRQFQKGTKWTSIYERVKQNVPARTVEVVQTNAIAFSPVMPGGRLGWLYFDDSSAGYERLDTGRLIVTDKETGEAVVSYLKAEA